MSNAHATPDRPTLDSDPQAFRLDLAGATVSPTALAPFIRLLEELGPEAVQRATDHTLEVLGRWGIAAADLAADPTMRVPHGLTVELLEMFVVATGDPAAALRAGLKLQRGDYELLEYLCGTCQTLGDSIDCLSHYYPLLIAAELSLVVSDARAEARFRIAPGLAAPSIINEFALASNCAMSVLHLSPVDVLPLIEVMFAHPAPSYSQEFAPIFGAPVRFGCEYNAVVFQPAMLTRPLAAADPILHAVLRRLADHELALLAERSAFPHKVRAAIEAELMQGALLSAVAERLHLSPGGLRSRLRQHGTTYSELLDRVRIVHAKRLLRDTQLGIAELAARLGFAHPPAFHRAFRRWFGVTPNAYREVESEHPAARFWRRI